MSAATMTTPAANALSPRSGNRRSRRGLAVAASVLLFLVGIALIWAGVAQSSAGGFFTTAAGRLSTPTSALVTSEIDVDSRRPADPSVDVGDLSRVRIRAAGTGGPVFLGIGPTAQVQSYLRGIAHDSMSSYEVNPLRVSYRRSVGRSPAGLPGDQQFWVARATGTGTQDLQWDKKNGAWTAVAMNADGRPGVTVAADLGLRFGFLLPLGVAVLAAALLCGAAAVCTRVPDHVRTFRGTGGRC